MWTCNIYPKNFRIDNSNYGVVRVTMVSSDTRWHDCLEDVREGILAKREDAFKRFVAYFGVRFRKLFRGLGASATQADDFAEEILIDIALKVDRYRQSDTSCFRSWVIVSARNAFRDQQRRILREKERNKETSFPLSDSSAAISSPPRHLAAVQEVLQQTLGDIDRFIVESRYGTEQLTFAEIAQVLNAMQEEAGWRDPAERPQYNANVVRVRHHRALIRLKSHLENDERVRDQLQAKGAL